MSALYTVIKNEAQVIKDAWNGNCKDSDNTGFAYPVVALLFYYLIILCGQSIMRNRNPISTNTIIYWYNYVLALCYMAIVVVLTSNNTFTLCEPSEEANKKTCSCGCGECKDSMNANLMTKRALFFFHIFKTVQLLEVLFLILPKRTLPGYYIFYQTGAFLLSWMAATMATTGASASLVTIMCVIFPILVGYDKLLMILPQLPSYNVMSMIVQMFQFGFIIISSIIAYFMDCKFSHWTSFFVVLFTTHFLFMVAQELLFGNSGYNVQPWCHANRDNNNNNDIDDNINNDNEITGDSSNNNSKDE